ADRQILNNVNLHVKQGEIIGIAGLMGAGRTELAMSVFGKSYGKKITGRLYKNNQEVEFNTVEQAIKHGVAYVSEDRKEYGLVLIDSVKHNFTLANMNGVAKRGIIDARKETGEAEILKARLNVRTPSIEQIVGNLSGGNQQKVVLGKWIFADPEILILDEPTRGIDVGAKFEICKMINQLAESGKSVIMISSELPELIGMCDRISTLNEGKITGELNAAVANQETLRPKTTREGGAEWTRKAFNKVVSNNIRRFGMIIALFSIIVLFQILTHGVLLTPLNITNVIMQNSYVIILAIGMMLVIITGEIDLSVGSVAAFIGAIAGALFVTFDLPVFLAIIICLLLGALIGAWQGFWTAYLKIPAFIVTLAGMLIFRG